MMSRFTRIVIMLSVILLGLHFISFLSYEEKDNKSYQQMFQEDYAIYAIKIPENISIGDEKAPLLDPEIYERFDRELLVNTYWQSNTLLMFKRAARYFPIIEPILEKNGIPDDFKYLALVESGMRNVVSPAGAVGFWQIMKPTANQYGLEVNNEVDERYHLEKATQVACEYLKEAKAELGTWTLAAASYNMGINGVKKQLERQKAKSYYELTLNEETARYVFRIMAVKEIMGSPDKYGFHLRKKDLYAPIPTYEVAVDSSITNFGDWAHEKGINYRILKYHNPWLRQEFLKVSDGKTYIIDIPKKGHYELNDEESVFHPNDSLLITETEWVEPMDTNQIDSTKIEED